MRKILTLTLILVFFFSFLACSGNLEVEKNTNINLQANSDESTQKIENAQIEVNNASININTIKNTNYSNVADEELRNRIINAARRTNK